MKPRKHKLSKKNIANLEKLRDHLAALPTDYQHFDMSTFYGHLGDNGDFSCQPSDVKPPACGTVACAVGHGPLIGIKAKEHEFWEDYNFRAFGLYITCEHGVKEEDDRWEWCFCSKWSDKDNTAQGAAKRIDYILKHGDAPKDWEQQRSGRDYIFDE